MWGKFIGISVGAWTVSCKVIVNTKETALKEISHVQQYKKPVRQAPDKSHGK